MSKTKLKTNTHAWIPDGQVRPGVPLDHIPWIADYLANDIRPDVIVNAGDWWDMPSLSVHDKPGSKSAEGRRYDEDVQAGHDALDMLTAPIMERVATTQRSRRKVWKPRLVMLRGNHEDRIRRAIENDPRLDRTIGLHHLEREEWETVDFLNWVDIDGIRYSHYFYHPNTGNPYSGENLTLRLQKIGRSFTMGHQQTLLTARQDLPGETRRGLVAGACYLHDEYYKGPQGNSHWRGVLIKREVANGDYSLMEVTLDYLCRRYEGMHLADFLAKKYPHMNLTLAQRKVA